MHIFLIIFLFCPSRLIVSIDGSWLMEDNFDIEGEEVLVFLHIQKTGELHLAGQLTFFKLMCVCVHVSRFSWFTDKNSYSSFGSEESVDGYNTSYLYLGRFHMLMRNWHRMHSSGKGWNLLGFELNIIYCSGQESFNLKGLLSSR